MTFVFITQAASFLTAPVLAGAGAAAISIPLAIHLLSRLNRQPEDWAAMRFLMLAFRKHRRRLKLEQWLLLLVRCLTVLVLGLALSQPIFSGFASSLLGQFDGRGPQLHIVIDDPLSSLAINRNAIGSSTTGEQPATRRDALIDLADQLIADLPAGDAVSIWRTALGDDALLINPSETETPDAEAAKRIASRIVNNEPTTDRAALRARLNQIANSPRRSERDLGGTLQQIREQLEASNLPQGQAKVVILSDWSEGAGELSVGADESLQAMRERLGVEVSITPPSPTVGNVQIASLQPRRRTVLPDPSGLLIATQVDLQRFGSTADELTATLQLSLLDATGETAITEAREVRFTVGQSERAINVDLSIDRATLEQLDLLDNRRTDDFEWRENVLALRAELLQDGASNVAVDSIRDDNVRYATVNLRDQLRVGVVDESISLSFTNDLRPAHWVMLALTPTGETQADTAAITAELMTPRDLQDDELAQLDALVVLRPDLLEEAHWPRVEAFLNQGRLVWFFPPAGESARNWVSALQQQLKPSFQLSLDPEVVEVGEAGETSLSLGEVPETLDLLGADWSDLLKPVLVRKRLPVQLDEAGGEVDAARVEDDGALAASEGTRASSAEVWVTTRQGDPLLLVSRHQSDSEVGDTEQADTGQAGATAGQLVLSLVAFDLEWTNLQAKPLLVPLLHETLKGLIGNAANDGYRYELIAGMQPLLGTKFDGMEQLKRVTLNPITDSSKTPVTINLNTEVTELGATQTQPTAAVQSAGLYLSPNAEAHLVVNVAADAGDTRALSEEQLARYFDAAGDWQWLDRDAPTLSLANVVAGSDLSWPLLWLLMALVLLETILARYFSHAKVTNRQSIFIRALLLVRQIGVNPSLHRDPDELDARPDDRQRDDDLNKPNRSAA